MSSKLTRQQQFELAESLRRAPEPKSSVRLRQRVINAPDDLADRRRQSHRVKVNLQDLQGQDEKRGRSFLLEIIFLLLLVAAIYVVFKFALSLLMVS